jgi:hypothetical protein
MPTVCIEQRGVHVRRGGAGDAGVIVKPSRRGMRVCLLDPKGLLIKGMGRRPARFAMPSASPHNTVLAQILDKKVQTIGITREGS